MFEIVPLILLTILGIYLYVVLYRMNKVLKKRISFIYMLIIPPLIILPGRNIFGMWFFILVCILQSSIVVEIINLIIKRFNLNLWRKLYYFFLPQLTLTALILLYGNYNINNVHRTYYEIKTSKNIEKIRVAFLSDIHSGTAMDSEKIDKYIKRLNHENIDCLILGGDIVDESTSLKEMKAIFSKLSKINTKGGIYYIFGNHDSGQYRKKRNFTEDELIEAVKNAGIQILGDRSIEYKDLILTGRYDKTFIQRKSAKELLKNLNRDKFLLLTDHQPVELEESSKAGYDLEISGHTHNGQIFPFNLIMKYFDLAEFVYGHGKIDKMDMIVSSGMSGWGYPIRTAGKSEYVIVDIEAD